MKVRQMCGGGTWRRTDLKPRRPHPGVTVVDAIGVAFIRAGAPGVWGPLRFRLHGQRFRTRTLEAISPVAFRAGWPDRHNPTHPVRRTGRGWVRVGPWVLGDTGRWDRDGAA